MKHTVPLAILLFTLLAMCPLLKAADDQAQWRTIPLIRDGQVAEEWQMVGFGRFVVADGALRTECDERGLGLLVYTKERLGNCQIRVVYRPQDARSNSGVYVRIADGILDWIGKDSPAVRREADGGLAPAMLERMKQASENEQGAWYAVHHGYEVQIAGGADPMHRTGSIYSLAPAEAAPQRREGEWRTMIITLDGTRIRVEQDGKLLSTFDSAAADLPPRKAWHEPKREPPRPQAGYLGLQSHDPGDVVEFKEIAVRPLPKAQ